MLDKSIVKQKIKQHEYDKVDQKILFTTIQKRTGEIKEYLKIISEKIGL